MLRLKNITKIYKNNNINQKALDNISINFREKEFVAILGPSGTGKTTLLNIIGGLDNDFIGDLIINNTSTKNYKEKDWNYYRNENVGFIFQNYNLIEHDKVIENVLMPLMLRNKKDKKKAKNLLSKMDLEKYLSKKPNELSGGQKQRTAIARALINDPKIILADEPTGALDKKTSIKIMELIKEISKDKLVIMVTHNYTIAKKYANRIIKVEDGKIISDSNPLKESFINKKNRSFKKIKMKYKQALSLSVNNLKMKKKRTFLVSLAASIGIIGISLILSISNGFNKKILEYEKSAVSSFPIIINNKVIVNKKKNNNKIDKNNLYTYNKEDENKKKINITSDFINKLNNIDKSLIKSMTYKRIINFNIISKNNDDIKLFDSSFINFVPLPYTNEKLDNYYDIVLGRMPKSYNEVILIIDDKNKVDKELLDLLFIKEDKFDVSKILEKEFKIVMNDDLYYSFDNKSFNKKEANLDMYNSINNEEIKFVGVVKERKDNNKMGFEDIIESISENDFVSKIGYKNELIDKIVSKNKNSNVVKFQKLEDNIITMGNISFEQYGITKEETLTMLGANDLPYTIGIYPKDFESKNKIKSYLEKYNITYTDYANTITSFISKFIKLASIILIAFSSISLIVSSFMIAIITYISVLERTKEIAILRSFGASKTDIIKIFNTENFIIGLSSGVIGIILSKILLILIDLILNKILGFSFLNKTNIFTVIILIIISTFISVISGLIPSYLAGRKNIVESLK